MCIKYYHEVKCTYFQAAQQAEEKIKCSESGSFMAMCQGNACFCLNATSGQPMGAAKSGRSLDNIDCGRFEEMSNKWKNVVDQKNGVLGKIYFRFYKYYTLVS